MIGYKLDTDSRPGAKKPGAATPEAGPVCAQEDADGVVIRARGVCKSHALKNGARVEALRDADLDVRPGEFLTLAGPSGCGKSTLLNILAGLLPADAGSVDFRGTQNANARKSLGYISQADALLPWRTVLANVELGLEIRGAQKAERREMAMDLMRRVGLSGFENCYPFELSGGMRKRAAVIRTLAYDPEVIFMDEPFVGLDVQTRDELEEDILSLWSERKKTIVLVTHDLGEAITLSDRVALMTARPGRVKRVFDVPLKRPRSVAETKFSPDFVRLHKEIWADLSLEAAKSKKEGGHE